VLLAGLLDDAIEHSSQRAVQDLPVTNHRRRVGDLAGVDAAEVSIGDVASHLPFELLEAPALEVLERLQAKHHLRGSAVATAPSALRAPAAQHLVHSLHELLVVE
jgi:hypothetical protein